MQERTIFIACFPLFLLFIGYSPDVQPFFRVALYVPRGPCFMTTKGETRE